MDKQENNLMHHLIYTRDKIEDQQVELNMLRHLIVELLANHDEDSKMKLYGDLEDRSEYIENIQNAFDERIDVRSYVLKQIVRNKN